MPSTIRDLTELTTVAVDDYLLISDTSDVTNRDKRISVTNLQLPLPKKTGTPVAGRVAMWTDANSIQGSGYLNNDLAVLNVAQSYSARPTFNAGLNLGQTANLTYFDTGAWPSPPAISGSGTAPTVTYSQQDSFFMRVNTVVFFSFTVVISTISGGSGNLRIGPFPFTASALNQPRVAAIIDGVAFTGTAPFVLSLNVNSSSNLAQIVVIQNNATFANLSIGLFGAGDSVQASGFYYV